MNRFVKGLCVTTLAASFAAASLVPATALPVAAPKAPPTAADVQNVQFFDFYIGAGPYWGRPHWRHFDRLDRWERRAERRAFRHAVRALERRGDWYYYNGYRGHPRYHPGYHLYEGYWFPSAAFVAGALITGAIIADRGGGHVDWCYDRYRSYRDWDNTFQPYHGPRRQCYSPYD
jgi:hypothetical protein